MGGCLGRELSAEERETVRAWQRSENRVKFNRARIVILAEHTANAAVIARAVGVHVQTVRDLARVFRQEGLAGLAPKPRPGRPRKLADAAGDRLVTLLHESPTEHGGDDGRWTLETAAQALAQELGLDSFSAPPGEGGRTESRIGDYYALCRPGTVLGRHGRGNSAPSNRRNGSRNHNTSVLCGK